MKNIKLILILLAGIVSVSCQQSEQVTEEPSPFHDGINWRGDNEIANYLTSRGIWYWMNIEREKAYVMFEEAVNVDSSLFACHTALALMSWGDKMEYHKAMAKKFVAGKSETSKLFVSLLDLPRDSTSREPRREIWAKMHEISNGPFIHMRYATSLEDRAQSMEELNKLEATLTDLGWKPAYIHNMKGYLMQMEGDLDAGTAEIEEYLAMYPDGYNPLDSRAEFYLFAGDTATAIDYYRKARQKFPFAMSAQNSLRRLVKD